jgi:hypothetical protein
MNKSLIVSLILLSIASFANAQNENVKVIALISSADWCGVCNANGPRLEKEVLPSFMMNKDFLIVMNDQSDEETKALSKANLEKQGIYEVAKENKSTGMIYFINPVSKKLISSISVSKSTEDIKKAFDNAIDKS